MARHPSSPCGLNGDPPVGLGSGVVPLAIGSELAVLVHDLTRDAETARGDQVWDVFAVCMLMSVWVQGGMRWRIV